MAFCIPVVFKVNIVGFIEETSPRNSTRFLESRCSELYEAQTARNAKLFTEFTRGSPISVLDRGNTRQDRTIEPEIPRQLVNFPMERQIYDHPATEVSATHGLDAEGAKDCADFARGKSETLSPVVEELVDVVSHDAHENIVYNSALRHLHVADSEKGFCNKPFGFECPRNPNVAIAVPQNRDETGSSGHIALQRRHEHASDLPHPRSKVQHFLWQVSILLHP